MFFGQGEQWTRDKRTSPAVMSLELMECPSAQPIDKLQTPLDVAAGAGALDRRKNASQAFRRRRQDREDREGSGLAWLVGWLRHEWAWPGQQASWRAQRVLAPGRKLGSWDGARICLASFSYLGRTLVSARERHASRMASRSAVASRAERIGQT